MFFINKNPEELQPLPKEPSPTKELCLDRKNILFVPENLRKYQDDLQNTIKISNDIIFVNEVTEPWESKLGGCPYLEKLSDYPMDRAGAPMMFLAQINLEEMPPLQDFPTKGLLQFYIADDEVYGYDEACVVKYIPTFHKDKSKLATSNPFKKEYQFSEPFYTDCKLYFCQRKMFLSSDTVQFDTMFFDKASESEYDQLNDLCYAEGSRVGGYPMFIQNSPEYYDDGSADVLLLQLDVDETSGLMFGDGGNCCFLISKDKLKNLDFSDVEYDWQCC